MNLRIKIKNIGKISLFIGICVVAVTLFFTSTILNIKAPLDNRYLKITIPENSNAKEISKILYLNGVIDNVPSFILSVKLLNMDSRLKAGVYYFKPSMSNLSILYDLKEGRLMAGPIKFVVPEGFSIYRIARALEKNNIEVEGSFDMMSSGEISQDLILKYPFLKKIKVNSLEGYLFPDTYCIFKKINAKSLAMLMLNRFEEVVIPVYNVSNYRSKYSLNEIIILASIIEKEAEVDSERAKIASVFYNRLENGMLLRADPTVKYALPNPQKRVYYKDLKIDSPYNTYKNIGLPPGPICNPGIKSILAALHPEKTDYLYFVSNGTDGTHTFSARWEGHERAVLKYRKRTNN